MVEVRTASGLVECTPMMRTASGLVECAPQFRTGSGLIDCGASRPLTAQSGPGHVAGSRSSSTLRVYTNLTTTSVTGGKAPYSYAWSPVADWTVTSPTSAATSFSAIVSPGESQTADFTCTVTDAHGDTTSVNVSATVSNYGGSGGIIP